jgi:transcriptional regulator with XRE-family HTH domain
VADNIRKRLEAMHLQQNELAAKIGMAPQQLSFYVLGKRDPREDNLIKIAEGL